MTPADRRAQDFKVIHGLARLLGLNDEAYRDMLNDRYHVRSSKDLNPQQRFQLIKELREKVHGNVQNFNELGKRKFKASPKQLRAIEAMWAQVSRAETSADRRKALNAFCKRLTGVEVITWICKDDAKILIKAIQAMGAKSPEQFKQQTKNK
jgi:hypothetical protein